MLTFAKVTYGSDGWSSPLLFPFLNQSLRAAASNTFVRINRLLGGGGFMGGNGFPAIIFPSGYVMKDPKGERTLEF